MSHLGNNVARLRGYRQMPQKEIAAKLNITQQDYSKLEKKEMIDDDWLERIAEALGFPVELIKQLDNTTSAFSYNQQGGNTGVTFNQYTNELDKIVELYERVIKEKDETIELLKSMISKAS